MWTDLRASGTPTVPYLTAGSHSLVIGERMYSVSVWSSRAAMRPHSSRRSPGVWWRYVEIGHSCSRRGGQLFLSSWAKLCWLSYRVQQLSVLPCKNEREGERGEGRKREKERRIWSTYDARISIPYRLNVIQPEISNTMNYGRGGKLFDHKTNYRSTWSY